MAKTLVLKAEKREKTGSHSAAAVRKSGRVPAVVYGHQQDSVAISLDEHNFVVGLHHGHRVMDIEIEGKKESVIIKDLQYDYLGKDIIHVDLVRVDALETITVSVAIELKGTAAGTAEGGIIEGHLDHLEVECKVTDIPESIVVSVKEVAVGDTLHASDVELGAGMKLITDPSALLVTCKLVAAAKSTEELEEEELSTPEVIGEKAEGEEPAAEEGK